MSQLFWYSEEGLTIDEYLSEHDEKWVCRKCGCPNVEQEIVGWVDMNTGERNENELDSFYCAFCEDYISSVVKAEEWIEKNGERFWSKNDG